MTAAVPLLRIADVAAAWAVSIKTVRRLIRRKEMAAVLIGGQLRIAPDQVRAYERRHEIGGRV